jgi:predicted deacylase
MAGVRKWVASLSARDLHGSVVAVPVVNLAAFEERSPFVVPADGKNLNRHFPGNPAGTVTERLADAIFTKLIAGSDAYIDAHCGDQPEALEPFAIYDAGPAEDKALGLALAYGLPYVIRQEPGPDRAVGGTSSTAAAEAGIPAITAEAGGCGIVEPDKVEMHVRGLDRVLAHLRMTSSAGVAPAPPIRLTRFIWLRSEHGGWWEPAVTVGDSVASGQLLGTVTSLDGFEERERILAPATGVPMFITSSPATVAGGLLLGLGA